MIDLENIELRDRHSLRGDSPLAIATPEQLDLDWLRAAGVSPDLTSKMIALGANRSRVIAESLDLILGHAQEDDGWTPWRMKDKSEGIIRLESAAFSVLKFDQNVPVSDRTPRRTARLQVSPPTEKTNTAQADIEVFGTKDDPDPDAIYRGPSLIWVPGADQPVRAEVRMQENGKFVELWEHGQHWAVFAGTVKTILSAQVQLIPKPETAEPVAA